jgi:hypothetical protein
MIQIEYGVVERNRRRFDALMMDLKAARQRGGGYGWSLMQSAEEPRRFVEMWCEASWTAHLRHHHRVSGEDRKLQEQIAMQLADGTKPVVRHYLTAR